MTEVDFSYKVVITGSLSVTKSEFGELLDKARENLPPVKVERDISKDIDYLITADLNSNSSKMKYARKNNIKIITENQARELFLSNNF